MANPPEELPEDPWVGRFMSQLTTERAASLKHTAVQCFRSQLEPIDGLAPVVPPHALERLLAVGEVVFR